MWSTMFRVSLTGLKQITLHWGPVPSKIVGKWFYWNFEWDGVELSYGACGNPSLFQRFSERKIV